MRTLLPALLVSALLAGPAPASEIPEEWESPRPELAGHDWRYDEAVRLLRTGDEAGALARWREINDIICETAVGRAARRHVAAWEARRLRFGPAAEAAYCPGLRGPYLGRVDELWLAPTFARLAGDLDVAADLYRTLVSNAPTFPQAGPAAELSVRAYVEAGRVSGPLFSWNTWLELHGGAPPPALGIDLADGVATLLDAHGEFGDAELVRRQARRLARDAPGVQDALVRLELGELQHDIERLQRFRFPEWDPWGPCPEDQGQDPATDGLRALPDATGAPNLRGDRPWPEEWDTAVDALDALTADVDARLAGLARQATDPALRARLMLQQARTRELADRPWIAWPGEPPPCHNVRALLGQEGFPRPRAGEAQRRAAAIYQALLAWASAVGFDGPEVVAAQHALGVRPDEAGWPARGRRLLPPLCTDGPAWPPQPAEDRLRRAYITVERSPAALDAQLQAVDALAELGHGARAGRILDWVASEQPVLRDDGRAACARARLAARRGRWDEAEAELEEALALRPRDPAVRAGRALLMLRADDPEGALPLASAAARLRPRDPAIARIEALALDGVGRSDRARRRLERWLERGPDPAEAALQLAVLERRSGSDGGRWAELGRLIGPRTDPGVPAREGLLWQEGLQHQGSDTAPLHPLLVDWPAPEARVEPHRELHPVRGDLLELFYTFRPSADPKLDRLAPTPCRDRRAPPSPEQGIRDALLGRSGDPLESGLDLARGWLEQGRLDEALAAVRALRAHVPAAEGDGRVDCLQGVVLLRLGERPAAVERLEQARRSRPEDPAIPLALAIVALEDGNTEAAAGELARIERRDRSDRVRLAEASLLRAQGSRDEARAALEGLIAERSPLMTLALWNLAALLLDEESPRADYWKAVLTTDEALFWQGRSRLDLDPAEPAWQWRQEADWRYYQMDRRIQRSEEE